MALSVALQGGKQPACRSLEIAKAIEFTNSLGAPAHNRHQVCTLGTFLAGFSPESWNKPYHLVGRLFVIFEAESTRADHLAATLRAREQQLKAVTGPIRK